MAFLDNSGDIILDAVLTDTGRLRLAQGDGSFKISKFALGDDEINYGLYNKTHASGSAYYDLEVLQTPVLEAFTNNTSNLKTKLVTISRTNILYMPILKLNTNDGEGAGQGGNSEKFNRDPVTAGGAGATISDSKFYVAVDKDTYDFIANTRVSDTDRATDIGGVIQGYTTGGTAEDKKHLIRVDQGLDTSELAASTGLDQDLKETAFIAELDYRLGRVKPWNTHSPASVNFIDDDNVASYYLTDSTYINPNGYTVPSEAKRDSDGSQVKEDLELEDPQVFDGPRGNTLQFRLHASQELQSSTYLFTQLGSSQAATTDENILGLNTTTLAGGVAASGKTIYYLDSTVRIVGANTGYRLDIPVRYVKIK